MPKNPLIRGFFSCLTAAEITLLADLICAFSGHQMPMALFLLLFAALLLGLFFVKKLSMKALRRCGLTFMLLILIPAVAVAAAILGFAKEGKYHAVDDGKAALFADKSVMIFAPHEDDELSMLSGTLPEYIKYGSEVRIVFVTNGDMLGEGERRINEALNVAAFLGLPEENIIFLGYGDNWQGEKHIYNAEDDELLTSYVGRTETYGTDSHPAYNPGNPYTRANLRGDIKSVIVQYHPEVIFSTEYEPHTDHRAAALLLEEAMAEILAEDKDYTPLLLKSISYHTSYFGEEDFYSENILSIPNPFEGEYAHLINIHRWSDRVRLPVGDETLSRSMLSSGTYQALRLHGSQGCNRRGESIISGDTVFWQRRTDSLSYGAEIWVSSGEGNLLNDFKLLESSDIASAESPFEGAWLPEDEDKLAKMSFDKPVDIREIVLYDNPSLEDNVLKAELIFDDGSRIEVGPLAENGSATVITVDKKQISNFSVKLLNWEGYRAGLTEIEAYSEHEDYGLDFIKLQNENGDFVYDYYIDESGRESFWLYTSGKAKPLTEDEYKLSCDNEKCSAVLEGDAVVISCPKGESCTVKLESSDGRFSDSVFLSNPGRYMRGIGQKFEIFCRSCYYDGMQRVNIYLLLRNAYRLVRYGSL